MEKNSEEMGAVLEERVGFYSPKFSLRIEITHPQSLVTDPTAAQHPERKMVQFVDGLYSTDDPEIIEALDKRNDVFRMGDPRVQAYEETAGMEPEEREKTLRVLERVGGIQGFERRRANVPGVVPVPTRE